MNRLATLALLTSLALAPLPGCMSHNLPRVPADEMKEIQAAAKKPVDIMLLSGDAIRGVKMLGWTSIGNKLALAVETPDDRHILIRGDQIQGILFDTKKTEEPEESPKEVPSATQPK